MSAQASARPKLPRGYAMLLCTLAENGGSAVLDNHARLLVGPTRALIAGDPQSWIRLVAEGYIAGEYVAGVGPMIMLTEEGRAEAKRYTDGCTTGV